MNPFKVAGMLLSSELENRLYFCVTISSRSAVQFRGCDVKSERGL